MPSGRQPTVRRLDSVDSEIEPRALGLPRHRPVLAIAGTTAPLPDELSVRLLPVLHELVAVAAERRAVFLTGGTDAGVIHLLGVAAGTVTPAPPIIGVAPVGLVSEPPPGPRHRLPPDYQSTRPAPERTGQRPENRAESPRATGELVAREPTRLEPNHDVIVLVPGSRWGDETPTLGRIAAAISGSRPTVAVLIGGGDGTRAELVVLLRAKRPVVVVAGSGRLADDVAAGRVPPADDDLLTLLASAHLVVADLRDGPAAVGELVRARLGAGRRGVRAAVPPLLVWPRLAVRPNSRPVLGPSATAEYPLLAAAIREADQVIGPVFREFDEQAQREQNRYRLFTVLALAGGLLTMVAGALQSWLAGSAWPGVLVATVGAATSAITTMARRQGSLDRYLDARIRAELLRALYFQHVAQPPATGQREQQERLRQLTVAVARRQHQPVRP